MGQRLHEEDSQVRLKVVFAGYDPLLCCSTAEQLMMILPEPLGSYNQLHHAKRVCIASV